MTIVDEQASKQNTKKHTGRLVLVLGSAILIVLSSLFVFSGYQTWEKQTELTQSFERCIEKAPFKNSAKMYNHERKLEAADLQQHFDQFNEILDETGLPPIWNGKELIPWKEYHQESIQFAQKCHEELGIKQPQQELRGSYGKQVWDPKSTIWQPE